MSTTPRRLTDTQRELLGGFVRQMNIFVVSGIWCGDCVEQCPLIQRIAEANPGKIDLRFVERDQRPELRDKVTMNGGHRVPVVLFLAEDFYWCATAGDRTIHRYRAVAARKLGPSCPIGIVPPDKDELTVHARRLGQRGRARATDAAPHPAPPRKI